MCHVFTAINTSTRQSVNKGLSRTANPAATPPSSEVAACIARHVDTAVLMAAGMNAWHQRLFHYRCARGFSGVMPCACLTQIDEQVTARVTTERCVHLQVLHMIT